LLHQDNLPFEIRYKSNMLKDTTCRLKTSECSSVIAFEKQYRIVSLCGFQKYLKFLGLCDQIDSLMDIVHFDYLLASH
jgi:hypothetical protein